MEQIAVVALLGPLRRFLTIPESLLENGSSVRDGVLKKRECRPKKPFSYVCVVYSQTQKNNPNAGVVEWKAARTQAHIDAKGDTTVWAAALPTWRNLQRTGFIGLSSCLGPPTWK
ncbi:Hypothetical protein NTJ_09856 [Nesidiocoris tenuis]|uniref:Secreted protein n=1 Tax=Nesidiocoris tenuis TaxID=355587 RepID=A0ABN7B2R1_9HEMI|nr:Hypothetical protein NTJ_09856 [Nesidiocoris tenuis]